MKTAQILFCIVVGLLLNCCSVFAKCYNKLVLSANEPLVNQLIQEGVSYVVDSEIELGCQESTVRCANKTDIDGRIYYRASEPVFLQKGQFITLPSECLLLNDTGSKVLTYNNVYLAKKGIQCFIATTSLRDVRYMEGLPVIFPKECKLCFKGRGKLKNGVVICNDLQIQSPNRMIFENVILLGTLNNSFLTVEWFGCTTANSGEENSKVVGDFLFPSAQMTHSNIFHSSKGVYRFTRAYPVRNNFWSKEHSYVLDLGGMEIYGRGANTVIEGMPIGNKNPADVINLVDVRNLKIHDLSITAESGQGQQTYGTNGISMIHTIENVEIWNCKVYNLPYVRKSEYPDGGKAFTIQAGSGTIQNNIVVRNNEACNVSYGVDYTKTARNNKRESGKVLFKSNKITNAIVGCVVHQWNGPNEDSIHPVEVTNNTFINCQVGINCLTCKGAIISNNNIYSGSYNNTDYYDGNYGIYLVGAYNVSVAGNSIRMKNGTSFIKTIVYSYYPQYNGSVKNITIENNQLKGTTSNYTIDVGSNISTEKDEKLYNNVQIINNKSKGGKSYSPLASKLIRE